MKQLMTIFCIAIFSFSLFAGCSEDKPAAKPMDAKPSPTPVAVKPAAKPATAKPSAQAKPAAPQIVPGKSGTVLETMNVAGYTYVQIDTGKEKLWAAGPRVDVKVGDDVMLGKGAPMRNYHSKTLDRTFDVIYFVQSITIAGAEQPPGDMPVDPLTTHKGTTVVETTDVDLSGITPLEGGHTVADIFAKKAELAGKKVKVRGKVVKFSTNIMGKNWLHLQDGTGESGTNDLTVTTSAVAKKGDIVIISGTLVIDRDFGYGYSYAVLIEDAEITVE